MYLVKLIKIESSHNNLRTNEVEGATSDLPKVGEGFRLMGNGLEYGLRLITTSIIKEVNESSTREGRFIDFKTQNSTYKLQILEVLQDE